VTRHDFFLVTRRKSFSRKERQGYYGNNGTATTTGLTQRRKEEQELGPGVGLAVLGGFARATHYKNSSLDTARRIQDSTAHVGFCQAAPGMQSAEGRVQSAERTANAERPAPRAAQDCARQFVPALGRQE
jgi:hypothetical protein